MLQEQQLSNKIRPVWGCRQIFDQKPWVVFLSFFVITRSVMTMNDVLWVHGHTLGSNEQWMAAQFDTALCLEVAIMVAMLRPIAHELFPAWLKERRWVHGLFIVLAYAVGSWHVWDERKSIPSLERRLGINSLYHNLFLYPFLGYSLGILLLAVLVMLVRAHMYRSWQYWGGLLLALALFASWVWAAKYDMTHQYAPGGIHKSDLANPEHPWQNGLIPQAARWLWGRLF